MKKIAVWFRIPVKKMDRAIKFYSKVFGVQLRPEEGPSSTVTANFPSSRGSVSGMLMKAGGLRPTKNGTMVFLDGGEDLAVLLQRVVPAGGKVVQEKSEICVGGGYMGIFEDSEGNDVGLLSDA
jgi:predicted enzyme related to lactoylglutathione lyase